MTEEQETAIGEARPKPGVDIAMDLRWLVAGRLAVLAIVLGVLRLGQALDVPGFSIYSEELSWPLAYLFAFSALSALSLRWFRASPAFCAAQLLADVVMVTGVVYATGGPASPFLFLYLPLVMLVASFMSRKAALAVAFIAGVSYSLLALALVQGRLAMLDGSVLGPNAVPGGGVALHLIGLWSAMLLVAVGTAYLRRRVHSGLAQAAASAAQVVALSRTQQALLEGIPDGVISVRSSGLVEFVNDAAIRLLNLRSDSVVGSSFEVVATAAFGPSARVLWSADLSEHVELQYTASSGSSGCVSVQRWPIWNDYGQESSRLYVFHDVTRLRGVEEQLALQERMARLLAEPSVTAESSVLPEFIGESQIMTRIFGLIKRVATSDATVLISGESGTGKELVARALHQGSAVAAGPFVPVNCGAIPENLLESEFFGHKKGAFTGADSDSVGLFRQAHGGTLFLDELGELPLQMQAKLLRALQEKRVRPVGGDRDIPISVRVVAATNRNLRSEVATGRFREDLFYRVNVISIQLPALRDRREDIPLLVNTFLKRRVAEGRIPVVPPATMAALMSYAYPGNVRELENILERAIVLGGEIILPEHLPEAVRDPRSGGSSVRETVLVETDGITFPVNLETILGSIERRYLEEALRRTGGAKKRAAELLGINFRSFRYRLAKFGLQRDEPESAEMASRE